MWYKGTSLSGMSKPARGRGGGEGARAVEE